MNWNHIKQIEDWKEVIRSSEEKPQVILKHSISCGISAMVKDRIERKWNAAEMTDITPHYLDLITYRDISNAIAADTGVTHQSPQVIVLYKKEPKFVENHYGISYDGIKNCIAALM